MLLFRDLKRKEINARPIKLSLFGVLIFLCATPTLVFAAETRSSDTSSEQEQEQNQFHYPASFFSQYTPQNAFEMVQRLPGFNVDEGDKNRGFGGNAGNVLIDGARPTSKSGGLKSALIRIPAAQVDYIEVLRGGVGAGETSGQSIVANVIRKKEGSSGTWAAKLRRAPKGKILPNIEATINTQLGDWQAAFDIDIGGAPGFRSALIEDRNAQGNLTASSKEIFKTDNRFLFINGEGATKISNGLLTLNGRIGGFKGDFKTDREIFSDRLPDDNPADQSLDIDERRELKTAELSLDWVDTKDDWKFHLIGISLIEGSKFSSLVNFENFVNGDESNSSFSQKSTKTEFISRATYGNVGSNLFKPEYGVEFAKNKLNSDSSLFSNNSEVVLDGADVTVEEIRAEIFATFTYQFSPQLSIEGGVTGEVSEITVSGDASNKQTFKFIKPQLSATYKFDRQHQLSLNLVRNVGQLNFRDFAASNDAADDNTFSGNPNLAPDISDDLSATYDWSFSERGSLTIQLFHHWKKDILEQIFLPSDGEGLRQGIGNAGNARFWGIETDLNLPLDWILDNGLLEVSHVYQKSSFNDPITATNRVINNFTPNTFDIEIRQDLINSNFAWGVEYSRNFTNTGFNVDERSTFRGNGRFGVFIETSRFFGLKTQLEIKKLNTGDFTRSRFIHGDDRGDPLEKTEVAFRHRKPEIKLSVSGTF